MGYGVRGGLCGPQLELHLSMKVTGGASSAVAASSHAACARFRGTDPLITGVTRRKLAEQVGHAKGPQSSIPLLRWMRAMAFERLIRDERFASEVVTVAIGAVGLQRPKAVVVADARIDATKTAEILKQAHHAGVTYGNATLIHQLAVPFLGLDGANATDARPDFAVVAPKAPTKDGKVDGSWLIVGDAKDYQRIRSKIDDGRLLKGFLQVALGAESAAAWSKLPVGMDVHVFGVLAVPRNTSLSPTAVIENLTDHREEVRMRVRERASEAADFPPGVEADLPTHLAHLQANYSPDSCPSCDMFAYCRAELQKSADPADLLIELGVKPEVRAHAVGLIDGATPVGKVANSVRRRVEATLAGTGMRSGQRRLDPVRQPGTVNVVLAKSDGAALGIYGIAVQRVTKAGVEPWHVEVYHDPDGEDTRRAILKVLGRELNKAITEQFKADAYNPAPIHLVVPDYKTADILVSIADSAAGKELSRLRWERDKQQGRPALTFNGDPAVVPPRLLEKDRVAVSFLLEQDRNRTMTVRSAIVDLRATLASLVTAGGPAVNSLRLDYLTPWADPNEPRIDHRALAELVETSEHAVGAQLTPVRSNAIHESFTGDKPGLPHPAKPTLYNELIRAELAYKTEAFDKAVSILQAEFELSKMQHAVRAVEADAQCVWRRRLDLHASDLVRFSRTSRRWRNDAVPLLEADDKFSAQMTVMTNPLAAYDAAQDAGTRQLALARVVDDSPLTIEVDSRHIGDASRIVALHLNGDALVEADYVTVQALKGSFKISHMPIGELTATGTQPGQYTWTPHHDVGFAAGDELIVADFGWFSTNKGDIRLNVEKPSVDSSSAPKQTCTPDSYADDPANHQWCCKPHEASEAEWSDVLAARRARGELNPQVWPPVVDSDAFDINAADEDLPDPADRPAEQPPEDLTMDDVD
ncbi:hypothetical protein ACFYU5_04665 [Nocardia aobensis]|uniref:PD-(D/E)XK endonuclease-like domain-containing protein n=1 Tax=Nocardia aobensis TaxID=257277 RepID=A0ABW6NZ84_9NOCA